MTVYMHTQFNVGAHRIHTSHTDGSHVQCGRCGIIKTRSGRQQHTTNYWCGDCKPYREEAA